MACSQNSICDHIISKLTISSNPKFGAVELLINPALSC